MMLRGRDIAVFVSIRVFTPPQISVAGDNPDVKFAMHVIASAESLGCDDLVPADCESINVDISIADLFAADGYGYIALLAYDVEEITSVEFAVEGWPTGRGAPTLYGPYWCPDDPHTYGDHLDEGGATAFESCVQPDSNGIALLGYFYFGPLDSSDVPIDLDFIPSTYTEPEDSLLAVTECSADYVADEVVAHSGCTIGGAYSGGSPDCSGGRDDEGGGDGETERLSASFIGSRVYEPGGRILIPLTGTGLGPGVEVYLRKGYDRRPAVFDRRSWKVLEFRAQTHREDVGIWDIVVERGNETVVFPGAMRLVDNITRTAFKEFVASGAGRYVPGVIEIMTKPSAFTFPVGLDETSPSQLADCAGELRRVLEEFGVSGIERLFAGSRPDDARTGSLASYYLLRFPASTDMARILGALDDVPQLMSASWIEEAIPCALGDSLHPNDTLFYETGDPAQWALDQRSEEFAMLADIDMPLAWGLLDTTTEDMLIGVDPV